MGTVFGQLLGSVEAPINFTVCWHRRRRRRPASYTHTHGTSRATRASTRPCRRTRGRGTQSNATVRRTCCKSTRCSFDTATPVHVPSKQGVRRPCPATCRGSCSKCKIGWSPRGCTQRCIRCSACGDTDHQAACARGRMRRAHGPIRFWTRNAQTRPPGQSNAGQSPPLVPFRIFHQFVLYSFLLLLIRSSDRGQ